MKVSYTMYKICYVYHFHPTSFEVVFLFFFVLDTLYVMTLCTWNTSENAMGLPEIAEDLLRKIIYSTGKDSLFRLS